MFTPLFGILMLVVAAGVTMFLLSLIGRKTNTTFVTKGGGRIEPYKTPNEKKVAKEQDQLAQDVNRLNLFCSLFSEKEVPPISAQNDIFLVKPFFSQSDFSAMFPNGIPNQESKAIINMGNMHIALKHFNNLESMKKDGLIDSGEYQERGKALYKKLSGN